MNNPEFIKLRNKFFLGLFIVLIFTIPIFFFFKNKFLDNNTIEKEINKNKEVIIYITSTNCTNCDELKKDLENSKIKYLVLNKDSNSEYQKIMNKIEANKSNIITPAVMYVKKSKLKSYIIDISSKEELNEFLGSYNLLK